jgi:hypothetical protein
MECGTLAFVEWQPECCSQYRQPRLPRCGIAESGTKQLWIGQGAIDRDELYVARRLGAGGRLFTCRACHP